MCCSLFGFVAASIARAVVCLVNRQPCPGVEGKKRKEKEKEKREGRGLTNTIYFSLISYIKS